MLSAKEKKQSKKRGWEVWVGWGRVTVELEARKVLLRRDLEEVREGVLGVLDARVPAEHGRRPR